MVGRDALAGVIAGIALALLVQNVGAFVTVLSTLSEPRHVAYYVLVSAPIAVAYSLGMLFVLYMLQALTGRTWLARLLLFLWLLLTSSSLTPAFSFGMARLARSALRRERLGAASRTAGRGRSPAGSRRTHR